MRSLEGWLRAATIVTAVALRAFTNGNHVVVNHHQQQHLRHQQQRSLVARCGPMVLLADDDTCTASVNASDFVVVDEGESSDHSLTVSPTASTPVLYLDPPSPYPLGFHLVFVMRRQQQENDVVCESRVLVIDETPPTMRCPTTAIDPLPVSTTDCQAPVPDLTSLVEVTDNNCSSNNNNVTVVVVVVQDFPAPGSLVGPGSHTVVFTATDDHGNEATLECNNLLEVRDEEPLDIDWFDCGHHGGGVLTRCDAPLSFQPSYQSPESRTTSSSLPNNVKSNGCPVQVRVSDVGCHACGGKNNNKMIDRMERGKCQVNVVEDDDERSTVSIPETMMIAPGDYVSFVVTVTNAAAATTTTTSDHGFVGSVSSTCTLCVEGATSEEKNKCADDDDDSTSSSGVEITKQHQSYVRRNKMSMKPRGSSSKKKKRDYQCPADWDPIRDKLKCAASD